VGKDAGRCCAVARDEERGRGKDRRGARHAGADFIFYVSSTCDSEWSETSDLPDVLMVALPF
jgi:hypothetical protein